MITDPYLVLYADLAKHDGQEFMSDDAHGHTCTVSGATWGVIGRTFAGAGKINLDNALTSVASLTSGSIVVWAQSDLSDYHAIISASDKGDPSSDLRLYFLKNGGVPASSSLAFIVRENAGNQLYFHADADTITANQWHFIVFTVGSGSNKLYIDGSQITPNYTDGDATTQKFFNDVNDLDALRLGENEDSGGSEFQLTGILGGVWLYSRALSAGEIKRIYQATKWRYR